MERSARDSHAIGETGMKLLFGSATSLAFACTLAGSAHAYSYASAISTGCHERITMGALRAVRTQLPTAPLVRPDQDLTALISDLPFTPDDDMKDVTAAALLVGVRDNDLKGRGPTEIDQLAAIHGDPDNQREHCLRAVGDDEPDGSARALESCKAFIREKVVEALDGLDVNGVPDPASTVDLEVALSLRGRVSATLPRYWTRMGQAVHTLQDGFSHTFRSADRLRVRTVLNWIEYVSGNEVESRDGPLHRNGLDECDGLDTLRQTNIDVASMASIELLHATLDPALARDAKLAAVDAVLAKYLSFEPGCTEANGWCDAPERQYQVGPSCGCSVVRATSGGALAAGAGLLGLAFLFVRSRRRMKRLAVLPVAVLCLVAPSVARAAEPPQAPSPPVPHPTAPEAQAAVAAAPDIDSTVASPGVVTKTEAQAAQKEVVRHESFFGIYAAASGAVTNPSLSGQLGVRLRLSNRWIVGLDGELNGWLAIHTGTFRTGVFNGYLTGIYRYPLRFEPINLRTTLNLGTSTMLIDLYGAPRGTTGIFLGAVPLGLEWKATSFLYVIFDVLGVALPIPQLKGAPFAYPQYRTAVGVELAF
jgi:MYXO-CTERM domain-containing protein